MQSAPSGLHLKDLLGGLHACPPRELPYGAKLESQIVCKRSPDCRAPASQGACFLAFYIHECSQCEEFPQRILIPVCLCGYVDAELTPCERHLKQQEYGRVIRAALVQEIAKRRACLDSLQESVDVGKCDH